MVYTNDLGVAETQFYSGYLSSKSSGVTIQAAALAGTASPATVSVIIGGTATSIIIGASTLVSATDTIYTLPMSVQVVDSKAIRFRIPRLLSEYGPLVMQPAIGPTNLANPLS
ncbi:MAG: hypothetical protein HC887_11610 [Desulfobacteraceae bacterium]|nr:hypothetical protein [Desulfobacteraceae bacterium]